MKFKKILSLFMMGVMFSANIPFNVFAEEITNETTITEDELVSGSALNISDSDIDFEFNITGQWEGGFNGEIKITNLTDTVIENWQIQMEFPQEITNIWNAAIESHEGTVYNIRNAGNNNNVNIPVGESVTFGFSGTYEDSITSPLSVKLVQTRTNVDREAYTIEYSLLSDWGSGYSAQITITNNTDKPFDAWHLSFDFDRNIDNIWNAVIEEHTDNKYYISNADYNSVILAGSSVSFGFNGSAGDAENEPSNYSLITSGMDKTNTSNVANDEESISNADYYLTYIGFELGDYADSVTKDVTLPTIGSYNNSEIVWSSSNPNLISDTGKVTRPISKSEYVTLTATFIDDGGNSVKKDYILKVIKEFIDVPLEQVNLDNIKNFNYGETPFIWIDENTSVIQCIDGAYTDYKVESPKEAIYSLNALKQLYGIEDPFKEYEFLNYTNLEIVKRYRLQQIFNGVPVHNSHIIISTDNNGTITSINGWYNHIPEDLSVHPKNDLSKINDIINAPSDNNKYEMMIYDYNDDFILCWNIYNVNDGKNYFISDDTLEIIYSFENESFDAQSTNSGETYSITTAKGELYKNNIKKYIEYNSNEVLTSKTSFNNKDIFYGSSTDTIEPIKFADVEYGTYAKNKELFDIENYVEYFEGDDSVWSIIDEDYHDTHGTIFKRAVSAYNNINKGFNFFNTLNKTTALDLMGFNTATGSIRPLYVVVCDDDNAKYSYNDKALYFGIKTDKDEGDYDLGAQHDVVVHEMTHGLLFGNGFNSIESVAHATIHEAYGDIMGCLANEKWIFEENAPVDNDSRRSVPRNIKEISDSDTTDLYFKNNKNETYKLDEQRANSIETIMEYKLDNDLDGHIPYHFSTILSCAAYKMNTGKMKNVKTHTEAIDSRKLAKIWYNSISRLRVSKPSFEEVATQVYISAKELGCTENQLLTIKVAFAEAGIDIPIGYKKENATNYSDITLNVELYGDLSDYGFSAKDTCISLYDLYTMTLIAEEKVEKTNGKMQCKFNKIPYGLYYLSFSDNRVLYYESLRLNGLGADITVCYPIQEYTATVVNKYAKTLLYLYTDNIQEEKEEPLSNANITIKRRDDNSIWATGKTDYNGKCFFFSELATTYEVYADDEFWCIFTTESYKELQ